jgi:uncharacterized membrane protein YdjX (TVP38/TMEM64 family)
MPFRRARNVRCDKASDFFPVAEAISKHPPSEPDPCREVPLGAASAPDDASAYVAKGAVNKLKIATLAAVIIALVALHQLDLLDSFTDPARLKQVTLDLGAWGQLAFVLSYTLLQPIGVPGTVFVWAAPLIWPWPSAFATSLVGSVAASVVGFSLARFIGREWVSGKLPPRVLKYEAALEQRAFTTVVILRFIFWMPQWLHVFLGISKVPFWTHFWGTLIGYLIPLLLVSLYGEALFELAKQVPREAWIALGIGACAIAAITWLVVRQRRRKRAEQAPPAG